MYLFAKCKVFSLVSHSLFKQTRRSVKFASYLPSVSRKSVLLSKSNYELIYDFPLIIFPAAFARSRYSVTFCLALAAPFLVIFSSKIAAVMCLTSAGIHYAMATGGSKLSENIVGKIYINKEGDFQEVIISSIDRSGKRIDRRHNPEDILYCDYYSKLSGYLGFVRLAVENTDIYYKVNVKNCKILNPEICSFLLGRYWPAKTEEHAKFK